MQNILIHNLGPVNDCNIDIKNFTVLTGTQASGKSTLSKSIFFFKSITEILYKLILKNSPADNSLETAWLKNMLIREIRTTFLDTFGSTWCMAPDMRLKFNYDDARHIEITLRDAPEGPNYIWVILSAEIIRFLSELEKQRMDDPTELSKVLRNFFGDSEEVVYIPAGRSLITLLSSQLGYIYSTMDDEAKRSLDNCTKNYLERILRIKSFFSESYTKLIWEKYTAGRITAEKKKFLNELAEMIQLILKGEYVSVNSEERLNIASDKYVKLNYASSGQQEIVWILNVLFYYVINDQKAFFIVEEPEAHLYPDAQKAVAQFLARIANSGNSMLITTHSPYILAEFNNLLYADKMKGTLDNAALSGIIRKDEWLDFDKFSAYFLSEGNVNDCCDTEFRSIKNEVIDDASADINFEFDNIVALQDED
ncbi:MAG: AAA family ATPase [Synergistes sp.]|nr:AAA family ATPase [Synergistes sp.]